MPRSRAALFVFAVLCNVLALPARAQTPPAAVLPPQASERAEQALIAARARHAPLTVFVPTALPDSLPAGQAADVKFTVLVAGGAAGFRPEVRLQIRDIDGNVPMNDDGQGADLLANDRVYSGTVHFEAADVTPGRCFSVRARAQAAGRGRPTFSSERQLCATRFPVGFANSDLSESNIIDYVDGGGTFKVVADEALILVSLDLSDDQIAAIAASVGGEVVGSLQSLGIYQIRLPRSQTQEELRQIILQLQSTAGVLFAAPNAVGGLASPPVAPVATSDPLLGSQWALDRINARKAWAIASGDPSTLIAVIDTGVDFDHPDFWATPTGTETRFAVSDGNIVAADCTGSGCVAVTQPLSCRATNSCNAGNAATDTYGHGTLVAGLVGAAVDNGLGIAGVDWRARLLTVRYAANDATATVLNLMNGINYARAQGARILSISTANPAPFWGNILCPHIAAAESEGRLVVAAAGNDGGTGKNYPAACAGAMPVANSDIDGEGQDVIHGGTLPGNYGGWVSIAAPGTEVLTTARTADACPTCNPSYTSGTAYAAVTGTSFSTPLAAGAAGLVLAMRPAITNADLRTLLFSTGAALQAPAAHIRRIDALAALLALNSAPTAINLGGACVPENTDTSAGRSVGTLSTVDADAGSTGFEYAVVGGADQAKFRIGGANADQLVLADGVLDYEAKPSYAVRVRSTDAGNAFFERDLVVAVCNVNEPPTITGGAFTLAENSPAGTVVGGVRASDPEGGPIAFAITAGNGTGAFAISGTGEITVADGAALDFETTPVFTLTVTVSDGSYTVPATVTVSLTDVDEAPVPSP